MPFTPTSQGLSLAAEGTNAVISSIVSITEDTAITGHATREVQEAIGQLSGQSSNLSFQVRTFIANIRLR